MKKITTLFLGLVFIFVGSFETLAISNKMSIIKGSSVKQSKKKLLPPVIQQKKNIFKKSATSGPVTIRTYSDLSIERVYLTRCSIHVVIKNKGTGGVTDEDYRTGKLVVEVTGLNSTRSKRYIFGLQKVDPQKRLKRAGVRVDFNTALRCSERKRIQARIEGLKSDGKSGRKVLASLLTVPAFCKRLEKAARKHAAGSSGRRVTSQNVYSKTPHTKTASFRNINLAVQGYRIPSSHTLEIIINASRKLSANERRRAFVLITFPDGSRRSNSLGDRRIKRRSYRYGVNYILPFFNVTSGGDFKVEVDPSNLFTEWDERDNVKTFHISTQEIERRWEAEVNLVPDIYIPKTQSHTVVFEVRSRGRPLSSDEERKCKVAIAYPQNQFITDLTQFTKRKRGKGVNYYLEISNVLKGGDFMIEVDTDDVIFEKNEKDNIKRANIKTGQLSSLIVTSPSSPLTVISGSKVNVQWNYRRPQGYMNNDFYVEIIDSSGRRIRGKTPIYNPQSYSYQVSMPYNLGTYRIKISIPDFYNSYGVSAPVKVVAATFSNPSGFKITYQPTTVSNDSTITISWQADTNIYSSVRKIYIVRPNLTSSLGFIPSPVDFIVLKPSGKVSLRIHLDPAVFEADKANIFLRFELQRRRMDQIDRYISDLITVRK